MFKVYFSSPLYHTLVLLVNLFRKNSEVKNKTRNTGEGLALPGMLNAPLYSDFGYLAGNVHSLYFANVLLLLSLSSCNNTTQKEASPQIPTHSLKCQNIGQQFN